MRASSLTLALVASSLLALGGQARAQPGEPTAKAQPLADAAEKRETVVEVSVLHGTRERRDNDPRIGPMPELREGPFANYSSYALLSRVSLTLPRGGKRQLKLPNGRVLETRLEEVLADGSSRLVASINRPGGKDFLPMLEVKARPGQSFIVAGQSYKRGILVLVIKVVR
jgi:hypothetical protein